MTENINVISIQQVFQDLSDIRDVDRYYLLEDIAKALPVEKETVLAFDAMYYDYKRPTGVNSFKEILIEQVLSSKNYIPKVKLDLISKGNEPWVYYIPKEIPKDTMRTVLPMRKKILYDIGDKEKSIIAPKGQIVDVININGLDIKNNLKSMFMSVNFAKEYYSTKNKNKINCNNIVISNEKTMLTSIKLDSNYESFVNNFKDFVNFPDKYYYEESFVSDVISNGLLNPLLQFLDESYVDNKYIKILTDKKENDIKRVALQKEKDKRRIKLKVYTNIIYNNFGDKYKTMGRLSTILSNLPKDVRKYVEDEYRKKVIYSESVANNKCPHLKVYQRMNKTKSFIQKKKLLEELETYMANPNELKKFITCKKCKFNIICPHLYIMTKLQISNRTGMSIRQSLYMYIDPLIDNKYKSFCKLCHDELFDANYDEIESEFASYKVIYTEMYKFTWSKLFEIFTTLKFVPRINPFDFGLYILFSIFPLLVKSKIPAIEIAVNTYVQTSELSPKLKVIILCYIYAYLLNMIRVYMGDPNPRYVKITLQEGINSRNTSKYAEAILNRFNGIHRSLYNLTEGINIQELFTEIYMNIAQVGKNFFLETTGNVDAIVFNKIIHNTTFNYAFHIGFLLKDINLGIKPTVVDYEKSIETILGKTVSSITRGINNFDYSNIYIPKVDESITRIYDKELTIKNVMKSMRGRAIRNYQEYIKRVKGDKDYDIEALFKKEKIYRQYSNIISTVCQMIMEATKKASKRKYLINPHITAIYDENGDKHIWDTVVYKDGSEVKKSEPHPKKQSPIVDFKSSKTGVLMTQTQKLDWHITEDAYLNNIKKSVFFDFFSVKCPIEGLHLFKSDVCTKCGYVDGKKSAEYYKKYKKIYERETSTVSDTWYEREQENDREPKKEHKNKVSNWKYNKSSTIEVSKLITTPLSVLEFIGAMEGHTVDQVYKGVDRPPLPKYKNSLQLTLLMDHYYNTCCIYNQLRSGILNDYEGFIKFAKEKGMEISELSNFVNYLPKDMYKEYNKIIDEVQNDSTKTPEDLYKVYSECLFSFIEKISKINDKTQKIAIYLANNVIQQELYTCVSNGKFDRSLFKSKNINSVSLDGVKENDDYNPEYEEPVNKDDMFEYNNIDYPLDSN